MGRTKGTKNKAGHRAGGARIGAGRKPKVSGNDDAVQSISLPPSVRSMYSELPLAPSPAMTHYELASALGSPAGPVVQPLPSVPISPYTSTPLQLTIDPTYPQESLSSPSGYSNVDATHNIQSPEASWAEFQGSPASHVNQLSPYPLPTLGLYGVDGSQYSPLVSSTTLHCPMHSLLPNGDANYAPNLEGQNLVDAFYGSPNVQTAVPELSGTQTSPCTPNTALITPPNASMAMSPGSDYPPLSPYPSSSPSWSGSLLTVPLPSPTASISYASPQTNSQPLPLAAPQAPEYQTFTFPYPLPASVGQPARLPNASSEVKRRPRRCFICVEAGREMESYKCRGRGDRSKCPFAGSDSIPSPPRCHAPSITLSIEQTSSGLSPFFANISLGDAHSEPTSSQEVFAAQRVPTTGHQGHGRPTGALQMALVEIPSSQATTSFEHKRRPRRCKVCVSNGVDGTQCPGRGNRTLCTHYNPAQFLK